MGNPVFNNYANFITFSRASNATLTDSTGKITYAPANLLLYSNDFSVANWTKSETTVSQNVDLSWAIKPSINNTLHFVQQNLVYNGSVIMSYEIKANGYNFGLFEARTQSGSYLYASINLSNGAVSNISAGITASSVSLGNGWYRFSILWDAGAGTTSRTVSIFPSTSLTTGGATFAGDGTSSILIRNAQLEPVTYQTTPSTYVATTTAAYYGPRLDYDPVTLAVKGLLIEEGRTNLLLQSAAFNSGSWTASAGITTITPDATTAPDGTVTADLAASTVGDGYVYQSLTLTAGTTYTFSIYAKALSPSSFNVDIQIFNASDSGNTKTITVTSAWQRFSLTKTVTVSGTYLIIFGGNVGGTGTFNNESAYLWGAQLEVGSFATSYIPTTTATVARSAEIATMTGNNFTPWYNQTVGTFVVTWDMIASRVGTGYPAIIQTDDTTSSNYIAIRQDGISDSRRYGIVQNGASTAAMLNASAETLTANTTLKASLAYQVNNFAFTRGSTLGTNSFGTIPTATVFRMGSNEGGIYINGHVKSVTYYPRRLSDTQLQALTS